jgi:2-C-methyl-D-erythritol 4-phosphate cytidylyltransferase
MTRVLGVVPLIGRGPLVHGSIGGSTLAEMATQLVARVTGAVVVVVDASEHAVAGAEPSERISLPEGGPGLLRLLETFDQVVVHDPLCPLVPEQFVRRLMAGDRESVRVAVRPVIDTVKATVDGVVTGTVDRERLRVISSPVVAPGRLLAGIDDLAAALTDLTVLVAQLRVAGETELVVAPTVSHRIDDTPGLRFVAAVAAVSRPASGPE